VRRGQAEHEIRPGAGFGVAAGRDDPFWRGDHGVVAAHGHPGGDQVTADRRARLAEPEHGDHPDPGVFLAHDAPFLLADPEHARHPKTATRPQGARTGACQRAVTGQAEVPEY
jgi:hypothetical protein